MIETVIYISAACLLVASAHVWSAVKSGCFYAAMRREKPKLLEKYINNLHYVQTPFWYSLFGAFGIMLLAVLQLINKDSLLTNLLCAFLISQGTSALAGPLYQGFVNVGAGLPFIDENERKEMELADPISGKTKWFKRFWYGKRRVLFSVVGLLMIVAGIIIAHK